MRRMSRVEVVMMGMIKVSYLEFKRFCWVDLCSVGCLDGYDDLWI